MKKLYLLLSLVSFTYLPSIAQNNIGIGTTTPHTSAVLDVSSNSKGILVPRMTSAQRNAIISPAQGLMVYDTDFKSFYYYNGTAWAGISGGGTLNLPFSGTASTASTAFKVQNDGSGAAIEGTSPNELGVGVAAKTTGELGWGLYATSTRKDARSINAIADSGTVFRGEITNSNNTNNLMSLQNAGKGKALLIQQSNSNSSGAAMQIGQNGTGEGLLIYQTNGANTSNGIVVESEGIGGGIKVNLTNPQSLGRGLDVYNEGYGPGIYSISRGNGISAYTLSSSSAAVLGDNSNGEAIVGLSRGGSGFGAVVGRNDSTGYGVRGFNKAGGIGVLGQAEANSRAVAGRFENLEPANIKDALQAATNGTGWAANFTNTNNSSSSKGLKVATANGQGGIAFNIANGTLATSYQRPYVNNTVVDDPVLVVTTTGTITIPTGAPLADGTHIWVMNNSGGAVSISNTTAGTFAITNGRAQQFIYISAASTTNWVPVQ